jgi:DNA primase
VNKPDLRQVLEFYHVELRGERRETQILCPIHDESRPSCSVNLDKGLIHCMSCGFGGDSFDIIMKKEGLDEFGAAVSFAEEKLGFSRGDVPRATGRSGPRVSRGKGFAPRYRNAPVRGRPLSSS